MGEDNLDRKDLPEMKELEKAAQEASPAIKAQPDQERTLPPNRPMPQGTAPLSMEQIKARQRLLEQLELKKETL